MTLTMMEFPVSRGIEGMNKLALFLNASHSQGNWHFRRGTRFDQTAVSIDFDDPADLAPAWRSYCNARSEGL
ncbi:hypothetical protein CCC_04106 [Paramagnetospirillum magnetotacticum MS-1]|uniref:Uncharacterized protein n=1 Tax=Paramagnetospirillum magnetotacticum MS-1 TaxID=272627 RepID=A0A0C2YY77_PARME|nr:hypothetical protein [Paramagnetospirillum magnetotacticum]KIL99590.1 hypothetical protein CCC_04106 [Paramagnetospirillum magnetotacticum MS-1]